MKQAAKKVSHLGREIKKTIGRIKSCQALVQRADEHQISYQDCF
jgi:hypothetical protein